MDNNNAERSIRSPVTGRKNFYGSGSLWASQLAAMMFSFFQTVGLWIKIAEQNLPNLILPWIRSKNLASKVLSLMARLIPDDRERRYNFLPTLLETFAQKNRFAGTCYKAANRVNVGQTKGRGKLGPPGKISVPIKDVRVYPLSRKFRIFLKN